jgi:alkaline phosphatase D
MADQITRRRAIQAFLAIAGCFELEAYTDADQSSGGEGTYDFPQGLASGDPTPDCVVLWTRVVARGSSQSAIRVTVEVSTTQLFDKVAARRTVSVTEASDFTARVLVHHLKPDTVYFYRFRAGRGVASMIGRTRTAPLPGSERPVRFAFISCNHWETGNFGVFRRMIHDDGAKAPESQIDAVLHLGDFIYEETHPRAAGRLFRVIPSLPSGGRTLKDGSVVAVTLEDYRYLYRLYLSDPDLQAARAQWPFIHTWDDHEFSNDCWQSRSTYTEPDAPDQERRLAATQAWFEYIPSFLSSVPGKDQEARDFKPANVKTAAFGDVDGENRVIEKNNRAAIESLALYRSFRWGRNAELLVTDLRSYRSDHAIPEEIGLKLCFSPRALLPVDVIRVFDAGRTLDGGHPPDYVDAGGVRLENARKKSPPGTMLGARQKRWLEHALKGSDAKWRVWINSVPLMPLRFDSNVVNGDTKEGHYTLAADAWDGYPAERRELAGFIRSQGITNLISLAGDHHCNFAGYVHGDFDAQGDRPVAVEFCSGAISSTSLYGVLKYATRVSSQIQPVFSAPDPKTGKEVALLNLTCLHGTIAARSFAHGEMELAREHVKTTRRNRHPKYIDTDSYGYAITEFTAAQTIVRHIITENPIVNRGAEGASIVRIVTFQVPAWTASGAPELQGPEFDGPRPFPLDDPNYPA